MATLYDNFSQVRQYIDQERPDLSAYATKVEMASYVSKTELSNCSYVTAADLPVIDENIVPKENNTYTLGDADHMYNSAYTYTLKLHENGWNDIHNVNDYLIGIKIGNTERFRIGGDYIAPLVNNTRSLGLNNQKWFAAYISNLYTDTAYLQDTSYTKSIVPAENNSYTLGDNSHFYNASYTSGLFVHQNNGWVNISNWQTKFRIDNADKYYLTSNRFYPYITGACHLGSSGNKWGDTYTSSIYADNAYISNYNNLIWTGTSAEYAALDNYTSYQIYMIKEA